jgi:hypothetical protein
MAFRLPRKTSSVENKTAQDILYTAACCLWATAIAFVLGWTLRLTGTQTGYTYYCLNAALDVCTLYLIAHRPVPYLTRPMAILLISAMMLGIVGWLDYHQYGESEFYQTGLNIIAALQILVFLLADTKYRMGFGTASLLDWLRACLGKAHK